MSPITPERHRRQADENCHLARALLDNYAPWAAIVAFCAALHYVSEYAAYQGLEFSGHGERNLCLLNADGLQPVFRRYRTLFDLANYARYKCPPASHELRDPSHVRAKVTASAEIIREHLDEMKARMGFGARDSYKLRTALTHCNHWITLRP